MKSPCLHSDLEEIPQEDSSAHDIVQFGRPLWGSLWAADTESDTHTKFYEIISLAKTKLLGGVSNWDKINDQKKKFAALAIIACTAVLYVSPASSIAPELVKSHMATLIAIDKVHKNYIITYPSEPVLSEAALKLMSERDIWYELLKELDLTFRSGGILDAGSQGELTVRLLLFNSWCNLVTTKKLNNSRVCISCTS